MIHESLVYETIDYKPVFYKGYKDVLQHAGLTAETDNRAGMNDLTIQEVARAITARVDNRRYAVSVQSSGMQLEAGLNLAVDIAVFDHERIQNAALPARYISIPPRVVIQVDSRADFSDVVRPAEYYHLKIRKLLGFGVEKVIWLYTGTKMATIAEKNNQHWVTQPWSEAVELLPDCSLTPKLVINSARLTDRSV